jgi:murein DD-endopeptidase MepM/ murein hydrolase activator NlpD
MVRYYRNCETPPDYHSLEVVSMTRCKVFCAVLLICLFCLSEQASAQVLLQTGFYYPVQPNAGYTAGYHMLAGALPISANYGGHFMSPSPQRVDPQIGKPGKYLTDLYHDGYDIMAAHGQPVYAIAGGTVQTLDYGTSWNSGGTNNMAVIIVHATSAGQQFRALYGHIEAATVNSAQVKLGGWVAAGTFLGRVGTYSTGDHLHLGINTLTPAQPLPYQSSTITADVIGWGRIGINHWPQGSSTPDRENWVDPVFFLETNSPNASVNTDNLVAQSDMKQYLVAKVDSSLLTDPAHFESFRQDQSFEYTYQWFYHVVSGQMHWFLAEHATYLYNRSIRYVAYENWDAQQWFGWYEVVVIP